MSQFVNNYSCRRDNEERDEQSARRREEEAQLLLPVETKCSSVEEEASTLLLPLLSSTSPKQKGIKEEKFDSKMDYPSGQGDNEQARSKLVNECGKAAEEFNDSNGFTNPAFLRPNERSVESHEPKAERTETVGSNFPGGSLSQRNSINEHISLEEDERRNIDLSSCHSTKNDDDGFKGKQWTQLFAAIAGNMGAMALGTVASWTATALPDLRRSGAMGEFSQNQESWIGSIMTLGAMLSCPVAGYGIEKVGRRMTMLLLTFPFILGWLVIFFAQDLVMIYAGRFITGFCGGAFTIAVPVFITETSDLDIRGALGSGFDMMITVGILYIFIVGTYASWRVQAISCAIIPLLTHFLMFFVPESPRFLMQKGKEEEAGKALSWFRSAPSPQHIQGELDELRKSVEDSKAGEGSWRDLLTPAVIKPTSICLALMFFQQLSGIDAVMFYTVDIFHSAGSDIDENLATNIVGAAQVAATVTAALIVDRGGRRLLLLISAIFMVLSLGSMGLYFYMKKNNGGIPPENLAWLPLSSLMVYVIAFSIGFGPIPWLMLGELIPPKVKGLAAGIVTIARWILGFLVTLVFQDVMDVLGEHGGYWLLAFFCSAATIYTLFCVPETKGKSLDEIQMLFDPNVERNLPLNTVD